MTIAHKGGGVIAASAQPLLRHTRVATSGYPELAGAAALLPQLARRLVKKGVTDYFATLKQILEAPRP